MKAASEERDLIIDVTRNKQVRMNLVHDSVEIMNDSQLISISSTAVQRIMVVGKRESGEKGKKEKRKMEKEEFQEEEKKEEKKEDKKEEKKEKGKKDGKKEEKKEEKKEKRKR